MAQLTSLRQRIKTIATINKTTHAMRLISMSTHAKLKNQQHFFTYYKNALLKLYHNDCLSQNQNNVEEHPAPPIFILISSQKGLCGNFNSLLFHYFENNKPDNLNAYHIITIGKAASDYLQKHNLKPHASYTNVSLNNFVTLTQEIIRYIMQQGSTSATIISSYGPSFFIQKQKQTFLSIPPQADVVPSAARTDEEATSLLCHYLARQTFTIQIQELIFDSLLAEQASRFLSMDSSSRNAEKLLEAMKLAYNKSRQATITQELTELAASLLS